MSECDLIEKLEAIQTRQDLAKFVEYLREDLINNPSDWENSDLVSFLEAMAALIPVMDSLYRNLNMPFSEEPSWKTFGHILLAAKVYE